MPHSEEKRKRCRTREKEREQPRVSRLEKEDSQERELCMEKKIKGERKVLPHLRKIISVCENKENKRDFFFSCETYIRIIVIDLIIVKLFGVCHMVFPFKEKGFSMKLLCSCV